MIETLSTESWSQDIQRLLLFMETLSLKRYMNLKVSREHLSSGTMQEVTQHSLLSLPMTLKESQSGSSQEVSELKKRTQFTHSLWPELVVQKAY